MARAARQPADRGTPVALNANESSMRPTQARVESTFDRVPPIANVDLDGIERRHACGSFVVEDREVRPATRRTSRERVPTPVDVRHGRQYDVGPLLHGL